MSKREIYLTDAQYLEVLRRGRKHLDTLKAITGCDSTTMRNKFTETNIGLCNDELTYKEVALWPDEFPHCRKSMKYRQPHHKCPLDSRPVSGQFKSGCFYTCMFFKGRIRGNMDLVKELFDQRIEEVLQDIREYRDCESCDGSAACNDCKDVCNPKST